MRFRSAASAKQLRMSWVGWVEEAGIRNVRNHSADSSCGRSHFLEPSQARAYKTHLLLILPEPPDCPSTSRSDQVSGLLDRESTEVRARAAGGHGDRKGGGRMRRRRGDLALDPIGSTWKLWLLNGKESDQPKFLPMSGLWQLRQLGREGSQPVTSERHSRGC